MKIKIRLIASILVSLLICETSTCEKKPEIKLAPKITSQSSPELVFKTGESVGIRCQAEALPRAVYYWKKDGTKLDINGLDIKQMPGEGTLVIQNPQLHHAGIYQCFAQNEYGTALSIKTILRKAELESFPTLHRGPEMNRPQVGKSLILRCNPPRSYPAANVYWGENKNQSKLMPITNDARVSLDFKGNLYFANVEMEDDRGGVLYVCVAHNMALRIMVQGDDQKVVPDPVIGIPQVEPPRLMWSSPTNDVAVRGTTKRMKCIFSGFPTPVVTWVRLDAPMPQNVIHDSFGQELQIVNVSYSDGGKYQCRANNVENSPPVTENFSLVVESPPYWRNNKPPEDVNTSEEEGAEFHCRSDGLPKPSTQWFINGVPIEELPPDRRRRYSGYTLTYTNVSKSDAQVIQCNVSNPHGYIFANAYLKIVAEPPSFVVPPARITKVAQGSDAIIKCKSFGAPKPEVIWQIGPDFQDVMDLNDDRIDVLENGDLSIKAAEKKDSGRYNCYLVNKFGTNASSGELIVTERTIISKRLEDQTVKAGGDVTLECDALTDPGETKNLKLEWKQDGTPVTSASNARYQLRDNNRILLIKSSTVSDSGVFKCLAFNGVDGDETDATLLVKDSPEPPFDVRVAKCDSGNAVVMWSSGPDNNDPISSFIVYYNTSLDEPGKYHEACTSKATLERCIVDLRPWSNFTFHVVSRNSVGPSERSEFSTQTCSTKPTNPSRHPNKVCTLSRDPRTLVIVWEPMLRTEHNGEGFHYLVSYKRRDADYDNYEAGRDSFSKVKVMDWRQSMLVIEDQPVYKEYVIYVEAVNDVGPATSRALEIVGFSSEDTPIEAPTQFKILEETLNSTSVVFMWKGVDTSPENIRGYFTGYEVRFWKTDEPSVVRSETLILREWKPCHKLNSRTARDLRSSSDDLHEVITNKLWPYSSVTAGVVVLNGAKSSDLSDVVQFDTPEGVPSMVPLFWVSERASYHLRVSWEPPYEINGVLQGYLIEYQERGESSAYKIYIGDPLQRYKKLHNLKSSTEYIISIWATTGAGQSPEANVISDFTVPEQSPDRPIIGPMDTDYDSVNISWSSGKNPRNPGKKYVVEYQKEGETVWLETPFEEEHNWFNVTELEHGVKYSFRVVAFGKNGDSMKSEQVEYVVGIRPELQGEESLRRGSSLHYWLIPFFVILLLLLLVLVLLLMFRNRGGTYPVHEKERLHGVKFEEEATFDEFIKSENSTFKSRQGSLESSHKSDEEEGSDSLGAYEDVDPMKFNEDGSFVDQVTLNSKPAHDYQKL